VVFDIGMLKSHPDKTLKEHIRGVIANAKKLTNSRFVELVAIFHDLGKINPNFQKKLKTRNTTGGYSNHAYLSAYAFFSAFSFSGKNVDILKQFLNLDKVTRNDIIALLVAIAKHHGNLPDFTPEDYDCTGASILSKDEVHALFNFLAGKPELGISEFVKGFIPIGNFEQWMFDPRVQQIFLERLIYDGEKNLSPLDFFIDVQFAFASLILADKADAGNISYVINDQRSDLSSFAEIFEQKLCSYLGKLRQDTELNRLRTEIRTRAIENIRNGLSDNKRVFELTAPTGSGKTLMMLSLASEIISSKGAKRIIYGLPFLSITEQVEAEVLRIFEGDDRFIQRIDSKTENHRFEKIQEELDSNPTDEKILEANVLEFKENTFAYPFIITTFVRFFETLLSNKNAELLKLPNFSDCIFLLDEIQALPPRLYGFFVAYLSKFCDKFNSYAIISTATQPNFEIPNDEEEAIELFRDYEKPYSLLPLDYFHNSLFNRYEVHFTREPITLETLKSWIVSENGSALVILNTIDDTKELYKLLKNEYNSNELFLLNTHFTPRDRKIKIYLAKRRLRQNKRIILISTQLIEAGVDIDFPVVYRDFASVASIVQSAGRCNRNGDQRFCGRVKLFVLQKNGKKRCELIYQKDKDLLHFTGQSFDKEIYQEIELISIQDDFFNRIQKELNFAKHSQVSPKNEFDFIKDIRQCMYNKIGQFRLIDTQLFGREVQFYVQKKVNDLAFEKLLKKHDELVQLYTNGSDYNSIRWKKKDIEMHLKKMSDQIVQVRLNKDIGSPLLGSDRPYFNLWKLDFNSYRFEEGIKISESSIL